MKQFTILLATLTILACGFVPLQPAPTATPAFSATVESVIMADPYVQHVTVAVDALNVRSCPMYDERCPATGWLYLGDVVTVLDHRGNWYRIDGGWIYAPMTFGGLRSGRISVK
jgi:uncharacterized protein YgiM (DUF1202 family)